MLTTKIIKQFLPSVHKGFTVIGHIRKASSDSLSQKMSEMSGYSLSEVVKVLDKFASPSLAESWDNVGLLVEPPTPRLINCVILTNDLTEDVLEEAVERSAQLILSYHPPIFAPLKSVTSTTWKERIVGKLLENQIALYSPHTAWDSVEGGVNDWLAAAFGKSEIRPIHQQHISNGLTHKIEAAFSDATSAEEIASFMTSGYLATPHITKLVSGSAVLHSFCTENEIPQISRIVTPSGNLKITKLEKNPLLNHGSGRIVTLQQPVELQKAVTMVKEHLGLSDVSLAVARNGDCASLISSIAVCAGSGAGVLKGVKADLYLTGEMQHHDVLDAVHRGTHVILTRHSNSERGFFKEFVSNSLLRELSDVKFLIAEKDKDPLTTV